MVGRNQEAPGTPPCSPKRGPGLGSQVSKGHEGFSLEQLSWASVPPPMPPSPKGMGLAADQGQGYVDVCYPWSQLGQERAHRLPTR